ncbi:MAG: hydrogenase expression/formation protein [Hydrogenobacter thermophilus]|uniref:hydrogenase expression/formation protein n=1 Tax=Hydrogenobacter thermophilus TaxID=940 RepID=UPI001C7639F5|nr:hydrogenase expression/formation protein [Hydrogenobacter thermophilus]QWK20305.1 MAG: hydrogenase expression/formation protein [Hydrogenobacter thermophilus]
MLMNAPAILNEILQALKDLYQKGEEHIIYINKIPLTEEDRLAILDVLGEGQVKIRLESKTQPAEWRETGVYGVWIGVFFDRDNKPILETIEITTFPRMASSQREDIEESIRLLEERLKVLLQRDA